MDGCGQLREYAFTCVGRRRCDWNPVVPAIGRATVDLQCPIEQLAMAAPSATERDFIGCGRAANYQLLCIDDGCTWVSLPAPAPPAVVVAAPPTMTLASPTLEITADATLDGAVIPPPPGGASALPPAP